MVAFQRGFCLKGSEGCSSLTLQRSLRRDDPMDGTYGAGQLSKA